MGVQGEEAAAAPLYLVAVITPRPERLGEARAAFEALVARTREDPGCELYDLVVSPDDPSTWLMLEKWSTRAHWDAHMRAEHVVRHNATASAFLAQPAELRFYVPA